MGTTEQVTMSKESRAALRAALKSQLAVVRKKVRTMRAKGLGGKDKDITDEKKEVKNDHASVVDGKDRGRSNPDRGQGDRTRHEAEGGPGGGETAGGLSPELKSEALEFFQKGNRAKTGKTRSIVAQVMTNEQRSFTRDSRHQPFQKKGKKK